MTYILYNLGTTPFQHQQIQLNSINRLLQQRPHTYVSIDLLTSIIHLICDALVNKALYLFAFFSFLCRSKFLPHTATTFDQSRQLVWGDIFNRVPLY